MARNTGGAIDVRRTKIKNAVFLPLASPELTAISPPLNLSAEEKGYFDSCVKSLKLARQGKFKFSSSSATSSSFALGLVITGNVDAIGFLNFVKAHVIPMLNQDARKPIAKRVWDSEDRQLLVFILLETCGLLRSFIKQYHEDAFSSFRPRISSVIWLPENQAGFFSPELIKKISIVVSGSNWKPEQNRLDQDGNPVPNPCFNRFYTDSVRDFLANPQSFGPLGVAFARNVLAVIRSKNASVSKAIEQEPEDSAVRAELWFSPKEQAEVEDWLAKRKSISVETYKKVASLIYKDGVSTPSYNVLAAHSDVIRFSSIFSDIGNSTGLFISSNAALSIAKVERDLAGFTPVHKPRRKAISSPQ